MDTDDEALMAQYNITCAPKMIYFYKQHRYENLKDAVSYAKLDTMRDQENTSTGSVEAGNDRPLS